MFKRSPCQQAYSLLELLITIAIVAVISGVSYYWYSNHLISTRRSDGQLALVKLQSALENYYLEHKTYQGATLKGMGVNEYSSQGYYRLAIELKQNGQSYDALAIPVGSQAKADTECGTLALATDGRRSYRSGKPDATCW